MNKYLASPSKTNLPVTTDLMYRLLAVVVLGNSYLYLEDYKLPFFDFFNQVILFPHITIIVTLVALLGATLMLLAKEPRLGALLTIVGMSVIIFGCRACYADSRLYIFSLLILHALYHKSSGLLFIRLQVVILYFGTGLNKLFDPDWQTGQYIENWLGNQVASGAYIKLSSFFPSMIFAKTLSWLVIVTELATAFCFTRKPLYGYGIWVGVIFHCASMIVANTVFGAFVAGVFVSFLAFIEWPEKVVIRARALKGYRVLSRLYRILDPYGKTYIELDQNFNNSRVDIDGVQYSGFRALQKVIFYCPFSYLLVIGAIVAPGFGFDWLKGLVIMIVAFLMLPATARVVSKIAQHKA